MTETMPPDHPSRLRIEEIARRLKAARTKRALTRKAAAKLAGISPRTILGWEAGDIAQPAWGVAQLAEAYGVTSEWIMAPPGRFHALVDAEIEDALVMRGDKDSLVERVQSSSVIVTDALRPVSSIAEWHRRMQAIWDRAEPLLGRKRGPHEET